MLTTHPEVVKNSEVGVSLLLIRHNLSTDDSRFPTKLRDFVRFLIEQRDALKCI